MLTYQDLKEAGKLESNRMNFVLSAISVHEGGAGYRTAVAAEDYYARLNPTISQYRKMLYNWQGRAVPDLFGANYKLTHGFFRRFVVQQVQYVLSNGVTFKDENTKKRLGGNFDNQLQRLATKAMIDGVSFGFWDLDHLEVFSLVPTAADPAFVPLWDEDTGLLRAGIRYWKSPSLSFRFTLYEEDGYTEYIRREGERPQV